MVAVAVVAVAVVAAEAVVRVLVILLMKEILQHLRCIKPSKDWDFNYQPQLVGRISEPSNSKSHKLPENLG